LSFVSQSAIALKEASGCVFYNISDWTLTKLVKTATNNRQILEENFQAYLKYGVIPKGLIKK